MRGFRANGEVPCVFPSGFAANGEVPMAPQAGFAAIGDALGHICGERASASPRRKGNVLTSPLPAASAAGA
jgi:hypothetical protein